jgi:hypothetical protein
MQAFGTLLFCSQQTHSCRQGARTSSASAAQQHPQHLLLAVGVWAPGHPAARHHVAAHVCTTRLKHSMPHICTREVCRRTAAVCTNGKRCTSTVLDLPDSLGAGVCLAGAAASPAVTRYLNESSSCRASDRSAAARQKLFALIYACASEGAMT